jgi:TolB-like protein/DNA-binding winged helix-turn-helix (wHTH) protein/Tfp pilus assembly protein PilF
MMQRISASASSFRLGDLFQTRNSFMQRVSHRTQSFDGFTLDLTRGCLLRGTQEIKLRPKPFDALKYLVESPGRLISKAELIKAVWPDTAVTDDSLVQCLREVRRALGDEEQQIIKTVPRRGYIFDRPVTENGPGIPATTYTEETEGVQVIIEERETNARLVTQSQTRPVAHGVGLVAAQRAKGIERLSAAIKQHVRVVVLSVLSVAVVTAAIIYFAGPREAIDSVAVMPFVNVTGDPNTEYLSDGISESIINSLSPNLKVIALNSVLRYKGKQTDPQAVGRELNVRAVLMGRLTQRGDDVVINVELVDVRDNRHLWGQQYNRKLAEITVLPTEIAQDISEKLRLRLSGDETKQLTKRYTQSGEAYQLYMMGRYYFRRSGKKEDLQKSIEYFEQAIKKDPGYAPAYAGLGSTYHLLGWMGWLPPKESWQKEEWAALKALQIDDELPEAHVLKAAIKEFNLDWKGAEEEYKHALELDPNSVRAHQTYAWHLEMFGRFDEAMLHVKRARELDPLGLDLNWDLAVLFHFMRQGDRAIEQFQKTIEMDPNFVPAHAGLAESYQEKGMYDDAIAELKSAHVSGPPLGYAYAVAGKRDEAQKMLDDLKEQAKQRYVSPKGFAMIYMGLGDKDQAFEWFNKTFDENPYRIAFIKVDPRFDSLRSDPRFTDLLRRMKLVS